MRKRLSAAFFQQQTLLLAKRLLGCTLETKIGGTRTAGTIVEVEAYCGPKDPASHSFRGRTKRTEVMFWGGGYCYVYFIYGNHFCVNVVSEGTGKGSAVLIRAIEPSQGVRTMRRRRRTTRLEDLTNGPGKLCQALGITDKMCGEHFLKSRRIHIRPGHVVAPRHIVATRRIGISKAKSKLWRFYVRDSRYVSKR